MEKGHSEMKKAKLGRSYLIHGQLGRTSERRRKSPGKDKGAKFRRLKREANFFFTCFKEDTGGNLPYKLTQSTQEWVAKKISRAIEKTPSFLFRVL